MRSSGCTSGTRWTCWRRLKEGYQKTGLLTRDSAFMMIELIEGKQAIGIARYRPLGLPDEDLPVPEIGFAIASKVHEARGTRRKQRSFWCGTFTTARRRSASWR